MSSAEKQPLIHNEVIEATKAFYNTPGVFPFLIMFLSAFFNAAMTVLSAAAETSHGLSAFSVMGLSTVVTILLSLITLARLRYTQPQPLVPLGRRDVAMLAVRGAFGAASAVLMYAALSRFNAGSAITLFYTSPTMTALLCAVFLGESFTWPLGLALLLNIAGVWLVTHPSQSSTEAEQREVFIGAAQALSAAFLAAAGFVFVKRVGLRATFAHNMLAYGIASALLCAVFARYEDWAPWHVSSSGTAIAILGGLAAFVSKSALNYSLPRCPGGAGLVVRSLSVPITYALTAVFGSQAIIATSVVGALVMLVSVVVVWVGNKREEERAQRL